MFRGITSASLRLNMNQGDLWGILITVNGPDLLVLPGNVGEGSKGWTQTKHKGGAVGF